MNDNNIINYEDLWKALKMIQKTCNEIGVCNDCPFGNEGRGCLLTEKSPCDWTVTDPTPVVRLLR